MLGDDYNLFFGGDEILFFFEGDFFLKPRSFSSVKVRLFIFPVCKFLIYDDFVAFIKFANLAPSALEVFVT